GAAYPFALRRRTETWSLELNAAALGAPAGRVYVFCLLVSALRDGRLTGSSITEAAAEDFTRLFQDVAFRAATQLMGNGGLSFGSPRPDGAKFLEAIRQFTDTYRIGEP